jgi:hypothetical protein
MGGVREPRLGCPINTTPRRHRLRRRSLLDQQSSWEAARGSRYARWRSLLDQQSRRQCSLFDQQSVDLRASGRGRRATLRDRESRSGIRASGCGIRSQPG